MAAMQPMLQRGDVVPNFTLPSAGGDSIKRSNYRARKHLLILIVPDASPAVRSYVQALHDVYSQIRDADSELLAIAPSAVVADNLRADLDIAFPLLVDEEQQVATRFLPPAATSGAFVIDRYGALHAQWVGLQAQLPPATELVEWLEVLDNQCTL